MKKLLAMVLSLFVVSSVAFAKPASEVDFATMNKADSQFLFQSDARVVTLDNAEMAETEGEWAWNVFSGLTNGAFTSLGYATSHPYSSTWSGMVNSFAGGFAAGFVSPSITFRTGASYFAGGFFGSLW